MHTKQQIIDLANASGIDTDEDGDIWGSTNGAIFKFAEALANADAKRLDFLGGPAVVSLHQYEPVEGAPWISIDLDLNGSPTVRGPTLRDAIDAGISLAAQRAATAAAGA